MRSNSAIRKKLLKGQYHKVLAASLRPNAGTDFPERGSRLANNNQDALERIYRMLRSARERHDGKGEAAAYYLAATHLRNLGDWNTGQLLLRNAERLLQKEQRSRIYACVQLESAEFFLEQGDVRRAEVPLARGCAAAHDLKDNEILAWALYLKGWTLSPGDGIPMLLASIELSEKIGCPELEWQAHAKIADHARHTGDTEMERESLARATALLLALAHHLSPVDRERFWEMDQRKRIRELTAHVFTLRPPTGPDDRVQHYLHIWRNAVRQTLPSYS